MLQIGTEAGLFTLDLRDEGASPVAAGLDGCVVNAVYGDWAVADGTRLLCGFDPVIEVDRSAISVDTKFRCLAPFPGTMIVGSSGAHLLYVDDGRLADVPTFDRVPGRGNWYTPSGAPPDTRSLAVGPTDQAVFVNVHVGGLWRGSAAFSGWQQVIETDADVHQVSTDPAHPDHVVVAAAIGFGASTDGGRTWSFTQAGLHASYCRAVAFSAEHVLVSASTGPRTDRGAVYRRRLDAAPDALFERLGEGLPEWFPSNIDTSCLAASGDRAVIGTRGGELFTSTDEGASWRLAAGGLPPIRCLHLAL